MDEMKANLTDDDSNIRILPFASQEELEDRLNAADIHLLSLRDDWTGIVVPSKFFGSLAAGKPVIYSGAADSCIGQWIDEFELGVRIDESDLESIGQKLVSYSRNPALLDEWKANAYRTYHAEFSRAHILDGWDEVLRRILAND